ncbi:MAG: metallo-mystery pair system four-Cys motif protein [Leptolyngbyaceae cyanobacterium CSU_1_3]|nr:metallo-mystery pair system four-Cys motif protein [Leptolyngbyaceae cyanobacterium CSU_1_3]
MKSTIQPSLIALISLLASFSGEIVQPATAAETQPVTIRFTAKVSSEPFSCKTTYQLGKPTVRQVASDFRFYVSEVALIDANGRVVPVTLEQDGKWQYQNVALLDFEDKTGACANGTVETRDRIIGTVPKGKYTGLKFTLGVPANLNHEDSALAPSPLNLTGLWWNWQFGYKFARIDLQSPSMTQSKPKQKHEGHGGAASSGFPIHLGSAGCQAATGSEKPTRCIYVNRPTIIFTRFNSSGNLVVADLVQLVATSNLNQNQSKTAPGCMSEPNDKDCMGIMTSLGLSFMGKPAATQTFFRVE